MSTIDDKRKKVRFEKMPKERNQKEKKTKNLEAAILNKTKTRNQFEVFTKEEKRKQKGTRQKRRRITKENHIEKEQY